LREREITAREREVAAREREVKSSPWLNPVVISILVAALGLFGNIWVAVSNNRNSQEIERIRAQSNLVFDAIKTNQQADACRNLIFLVGLGLLDDPRQAIHQSCVTEPSTAPLLPAVSTPSTFSSPFPIVPISGYVQDADTLAPISGATVVLSPLLSSVSTDKNGFFSIQPTDSVRFTTHLLSIQKDGYTPLTVDLSTTLPALVYKMHKTK
jgi:hypothetical protein